MTTLAEAEVTEPVGTATANPAPVAEPIVPVQLELFPEVVAPAAAPAAAPASETPISYEPTGDTGLDVALNFVGNLGIAQDHPAMLATETGDFSLIKAHLATMGDKARGWEQMVALAEQAHERHAAAALDTATKVAAACVAVAGGEAQWAAIQAWATKNADPAEKVQINAMFDTGPVGARAAVTLLRDAYSKANGTVVKPDAATREVSAGASTVPDTGKLSPREYGAEVRKLHQKLGNRMDQSHEYAVLRARL